MNVCVCVWFRMCVECFLLTNAGYNAPHANQQPQCITWVALLASTPSICWFHNFLILDPKLLSLFFTPPNPRTINIHYAYINTFAHKQTNKYLWCVCVCVRVFLRGHTVYYLLCLLSALMKIVTHISHAHTDSLFFTLTLSHTLMHTYARIHICTSTRSRTHTVTHTLFINLEHYQKSASCRPKELFPFSC